MGDPQPSPLVSILNHGPWRLDDNWGYHEKTETSIWNSLTMCDTRWIIDSPVPKYDLVYFPILSPNMMVDVLISCLKMTTFSWANAPTESNIPEKHRLFYDLDPSDRKLFEKHSLDRGDWIDHGRRDLWLKGPENNWNITYSWSEHFRTVCILSYIYIRIVACLDSWPVEFVHHHFFSCLPICVCFLLS